MPSFRRSQRGAVKAGCKKIIVTWLACLFSEQFPNKTECPVNSVFTLFIRFSLNFAMFSLCYKPREYAIYPLALSEWHSRGQRFDPAYLHQDLKSSDFRSFPIMELFRQREVSPSVRRLGLPGPRRRGHPPAPVSIYLAEDEVFEVFGQAGGSNLQGGGDGGEFLVPDGFFRGRIQGVNFDAKRVIFAKRLKMCEKICYALASTKGRGVPFGPPFQPADHNIRSSPPPSRGSKHGIVLAVGCCIFIGLFSGCPGGGRPRPGHLLPSRGRSPGCPCR